MPNKQPTNKGRGDAAYHRWRHSWLSWIFPHYHLPTHTLPLTLLLLLLLFLLSLSLSLSLSLPPYLSLSFFPSLSLSLSNFSMIFISLIRIRRARISLPNFLGYSTDLFFSPLHLPTMSSRQIYREFLKFHYRHSVPKIGIVTTTEIIYKNSVIDYDVTCKLFPKLDLAPQRDN